MCGQGGAYAIKYEIPEVVVDTSTLHTTNITGGGSCPASCINLLFLLHYASPKYHLSFSDMIMVTRCDMFIENYDNKNFILAHDITVYNPTADCITIRVSPHLT